MQTVTQNTPQQINSALLSLQTELLQEIKEVKDELNKIKEILNNEQ